MNRTRERSGIAPARASGSPDAAPPLDARACDALCLAFALWTLCCHAVVGLGGSLHQLLATAAGAAVLALIVAGALRRRRRRGGDAPAAARAGPAPAAVGPTGDAGRLARAAPWAGALLAAAAVVLWRPREHPLALWGAGALLLAAAAVVAVTGPLAPAAPHRDRASTLALWALAALGALVALVCHRPDIDDAFYVNVAVAAADHPGRALLARDTVHGLHHLPLHQPAYRLHGWELWNGALAYLSGLPAIHVFHWLAAAGVGLFVPLAHARLFRLLAPRRWPWAVAALVLVLLAAGETHRWYGNFAFVRAWQGKAALLFVFMPLVQAAALRFALRPGAREWLLLAAAQIAALGSSSTAVWMAPAGAAIALACALRPDREGLRRLALGLSTSLYVLAAGWLLKGSLQTYAAPLLEQHARGEQLAEALLAALGDGRLQLAALGCALGGWALCPPGLARRFAVAFPLAVWVGLLNPAWDGWIAANLTGPSYWRTMWSLPLPVLMALVLVAPLRLRGSARRRALGVTGALALAAGFAIFVPRFGALSARNAGPAGVGIWLGAPGVKAPPGPYLWAARLNARVEPGDAVVAPLPVAFWIPTFHHHAHALLVRPPYLFRYREILGDAELERRWDMARYAAGQLDGPDAHRAFRRGLRDFDVKGVVLRMGEHGERARAALRDLGFHRTLQEAGHELWGRP